MANYEFITLRLNTEKEEEKMIWENINNSNRAGHVKKILKQHFGIGVIQFNQYNKKKVENYNYPMDPDVNKINQSKKLIKSNGIKINVGGNERWAD